MHSFPPEIISRLKFMIMIFRGVGLYCFLQNTKNSKKFAASILKIEASEMYELEAVVFPNTLVPVCKTTRRHNLRHSNLLTRSDEDIKCTKLLEKRKLKYFLAFANHSNSAGNLNSQILSL
jgi:hypothetical protein